MRLFGKSKVIHRRGDSRKVPAPVRRSGQSIEDLQSSKEQQEYEEWRSHQESLVLELPWFGERIMPIGAAGRRRKGEPLSKDDEARVILSWLAGGSSGRIASRVGVSRRTVYNVIRRWVYHPEPEQLLVPWFEADLFACMFSPRFRTVENSGYQDAICLICHQVVGHYYWPMNAGDRVGKVFRPEPDRHMPWGNRLWTARDIQTHLVLHFWLDEVPENNLVFWGQTAWDCLPETVSERADIGAAGRHLLTSPMGVGVGSEEEWRRWRLVVLTRKSGSKPPPPPAPKRGGEDS